MSWISETEKDHIVDFYQNGLSIRETAVRSGRCDVSCRNILIEREIPRRKTGRSHVTDEERRIMIEAYQQGMSSYAASALAGYTFTTALKVLREHGVERRSHTAYRKYNYDTSFFEKIDTAEKAYWLGFMTADGSLTVPTQGRWRTSALGVGLARKDEQHLRTLRSALKSDHRIRRDTTVDKRSGKRYNRSQFHIYSKQIVEQLLGLGLMANKSLVVRPCELVPSHFLRDYYRGLFDGDGSISPTLSSTGSRQWHLTFCGTRPIVEGFMNFIAERTGVKETVNPSGNIFTVEYNGVALAQIVLAELYVGGGPSLPRKRKLAEKVMRTRWKKETPFTRIRQEQVYRHTMEC